VKKIANEAFIVTGFVADDIRMCNWFVSFRRDYNEKKAIIFVSSSLDKSQKPLRQKKLQFRIVELHDLKSWWLSFMTRMVGLLPAFACAYIALHLRVHVHKQSTESTNFEKCQEG
jgi:hypothetical protein